MKISEKTPLSIAVLPFVNMNREDGHEFFCDGISEEIINALSHVKGLKAISRTSSFYYKNHPASIREIGSALQVSVILEGSVRISGGTLRISAQLINTADDAPFWSERWDRKMENIFEIQDEISLLIADQLREHLGHLVISDRLVERTTQDLNAYEYYLKGRFHFLRWNPEDASVAIEQFEKAVALDEELIEAHLGLADSYSFLAVAGFAPREASWNKAIESIKKAKNLDPENANLNYMLANQAFFTEADYPAAMQYALKSLVRKPNYPEAHLFLSFLYTLRSDLKKSKKHLLYARSVDPLNQETKFYDAYFHYRSRDYSGASAILSNLLEENPKNIPAIIVSLYIQIKEKQFDRAEKSLQSIPDGLLTPDEGLGLRCLLEAARGESNPQLLAELEAQARPPQAHHAHSYLYLVYSEMGKNDQAFEILEKLFVHRSSVLLLGFNDPLAEKITKDHRYNEYHSRVYPIANETSGSKKLKEAVIDKYTAQQFVNKLNEYIDAEEPYLNPSITLRLLAQHVDIHPNHLSWVLNQCIGQNFNEFINHLRIEHFKKIAVDPSNAHISLLGLAYESGFNSKTVFNTHFKKVVGMTPSHFLKSQKKGHSK